MADSEATTVERIDRPAVTVVVPFRGEHASGLELMRSLTVLRTRDSDQVLLSENADQPTLPPAETSDVEVVRAPDHPSSYYARNVGAERASNEWLLFIDADCEPAADLLDAFFAAPIAQDCGAVAGEIQARGAGLLSRWADSRGLLRQSVSITHPYRPSAVTANLLVRRAAWLEIGGFQEGIRSGGDGDFCWRLQEAGWELEHRPAAVVRHAHRESVGDLASQLARHAAGAAWLNRRYPGSSRRPKLARGLARCMAAAAAWTLTGRFERAAFKLIDAIAIASTGFGYLVSNGSPHSRERRSENGVALVVDEFPAEPRALEAVRKLLESRSVRVVARRRPARPLLGGLRAVSVDFHEDAAALSRFKATVRLIFRHPVRSLRMVMSGDHRALPGGFPALALSSRTVSTSSVIDARFAGQLSEHAAQLRALVGPSDAPRS